jgi:enterochelin esterase-like enzyme
MSQDQRWWTEVARVDRIATAMIESGKIRPLIIAMPNGNRVQADISTTSIYDDHCRTGLDILARVLKAIGDVVKPLRIYKVSCDGNFEAYIANELVQDIDSRYSTNGERYIGGFSTGGRGALQLAFGNDDVFGGAFGLSGNYDYLRSSLRSGELPAGDLRLFLASGDNDQRGVYGELGTVLFHRDLAARGMDHRYCIYEGTHSDTVWVSALPGALRYLFASEGNISPEGNNAPDGDIAPEGKGLGASGSTVGGYC